jgi:hypothetical protein
MHSVPDATILQIPQFQYQLDTCMNKVTNSADRIIQNEMHIIAHGAERCTIVLL